MGVVSLLLHNPDKYLRELGVLLSGMYHLVLFHMLGCIESYTLGLMDALQHAGVPHTWAYRPPDTQVHSIWEAQYN